MIFTVKAGFVRSCWQRMRCLCIEDTDCVKCSWIFCHVASCCTPNVEITALTADNFVYNISTEACFVFSRWEPRAQEIRYVEYPSFVKSVLAPIGTDELGRR
jgi:hypothetical protein